MTIYKWILFCVLACVVGCGPTAQEQYNTALDVLEREEKECDEVGKRYAGYIVDVRDSKTLSDEEIEQKIQGYFDVARRYQERVYRAKEEAEKAQQRLP